MFDFLFYVGTHEQRWEILREIDLQKMPILAKKKSSFQMKFIVKNEIKYLRTFEMLTLAFDESTISRTQGQEYVNDDARSGRPNTSTTDEHIVAVKKMILYNLRITIREVAHNVGVPFGS